jgi:hypothetical protein
MQQLLEIYPHMKEDDVETLDKILTDAEFEEIIESYGKQS